PPVTLTTIRATRSPTCCSRSTANTIPRWWWSRTIRRWPRAARGYWILWMVACRRTRHERPAPRTAHAAARMAPAGTTHADRRTVVVGDRAGRGRHPRDARAARGGDERGGIDRRRSGHRCGDAVAGGVRATRASTRAAHQHARRFSQRGV